MQRCTPDNRNAGPRVEPVWATATVDVRRLTARWGFCAGDIAAQNQHVEHAHNFYANDRQEAINHINISLGDAGLSLGRPSILLFTNFMAWPSSHTAGPR